MRILVQRSLNSKVTVKNKVTGEIKNGLVLFVSFTHSDSISDIDYLINKVLNLRIFDDENHVMNKSILDVNGSILSISQFTLYADSKKGNRPSYNNVMKSDEAKILYDLFNNKLSQHIDVQKGIFGAEMCVSITNDGPVTILLESKN